MAERQQELGSRIAEGENVAATTTQSTASLRALLSDVFDYAGVFPPAGLSLPEAVDHYANYQRDSDAWMLARFVCPARRLAELEPLAALPGRLAVPGRPAESAAHFWIELQQDQQALGEFQSARRQQVRVELLELPLPDEVTWGSDADADGFFRAVLERLGGWHLTAVLFEVPLADAGPERLLLISKAMGSASASAPRVSPAPRLGLKLRLGGATAAGGPTAEQLAWFIAACRDAGIPWKATAGLHQPLRCVDIATGHATHGFLNVLVATVLAAAHGFPAAQVGEIVNDPQAAHFVFHDAGLSWKDWRATTEQVRLIRERAFISVGSCSFEEPQAGLRELGLL